MGDALDRQDIAQALREETLARRARLAGNFDLLEERLQPYALVAGGIREARRAVRDEVHRMMQDFGDLGADLIDDSLSWAGRNRLWLMGGAAAGLLLVAGTRLATRKRTVPLYAAYDMEDPDMTNEHDTPTTDAAGTWNKVKGEAEHLSAKAGEAYYAARSRAADLAETARDRANHAADVAREKAHEAAEAAREAADRAREAAGEAGRWAKRQPAENPMTVVVVALAVGALLGALLPRGGRQDL
jgi:ElaB/YqjD/DUF883 family membrane-anchored ribosome-binding protein